MAVGDVAELRSEALNKILATQVKYRFGYFQIELVLNVRPLAKKLPEDWDVRLQTELIWKANGMIERSKESTVVFHCKKKFPSVFASFAPSPFSFQAWT